MSNTPDNKPTSDPSGKQVVLINGEKCCAACCKPIFQEVDPSGKVAQTAKELLAYQGWTDGENNNHRDNKWWMERMEDLAEVRTYSLRQQLSDSKKESLVWAKGLADERELHGEQVRAMRKFAVDLEERLQEKVADLEKDLSEAQGKVSQLEAERKYFHDAYARKLDETIDALGKLLSVTDERDFLERELNNFRRNAAHRAEQIAEEKLAPLTSQVSVLTKERDEARCRTISGDKESVWGVYRHPDESLTSSNLGAWYSTAVFHRKREDAAALAGIKFGDHPENFTATNVRAELAESRLSAVSEVVRTAAQSVAILRDAANTAQSGGKLATAQMLRNQADTTDAALTSYEKAQQNIPE